MGDARFDRLRRALLGATLFYAVLGLALAFGGQPLFGLWRDLVARSMLGGPFPDELAGLARLTEGILGGSIVGKWVASAWLVHHPLRRRERWAVDLLLASHLVWFALDSTCSVIAGAAINVVVINLFPLLLVGGLALAIRPHTRAAPRRVEPMPLAARVLFGVCVASIAPALAVGFAVDGRSLAPYHAAIGDHFFEGVWTPAGLAWERFAYGLIGGTVAGHFVALAGALAVRPTERWTIHAVVSSVLAWFVVDSAVCAMESAWFNIWMVNLPSLAAVVVPAAFAFRSAR